MLHGIAIGDLHFDKLRNRFPGRDLELQYQAINSALTYAYKNGIKYVFFLGDIGEGYKDFTGKLVMSSDAHVMLLRIIRQWDKKLRLIFYNGNHDHTELGSSTLDMFLEMYRHKMFETTSFHDKYTELKLGGERVNILPFPVVKPDSKKPALNFAHYEVSGAVADSGRKINSDHKHDYKDMIFIQGHLHTPQKVRNHYYPGTLYQTTFGESLPKGFAEFKYEAETSTFKYRFVETDPPFKLINLRVYKRSDLKKLVNDPNILYKLFIDESVKVKPSDLAPFSNIENQLTFGSEEEASSLEFAEFMIENQELEFQYDDALEEALKARGASKQDVEACKVVLSAFKNKQTSSTASTSTATA